MIRKESQGRGQGLCLEVQPIVLSHSKLRTNRLCHLYEPELGVAQIGHSLLNLLMEGTSRLWTIADLSLPYHTDALSHHQAWLSGQTENA